MAQKKEVKRKDAKVGVEVELIVPNSRRTTRRKHKRRTNKGGTINVKKHILSIKKHAQSAIKTGQKLKKEIDSQRKKWEAEKEQAKLDAIKGENQRLIMKREVMGLKARAAMLALEQKKLTDQLKDEELSMDEQRELRKKQHEVSKQVNQSKAKALELAGKAEEMAQATFAAEAKRQAVNAHLNRLRDIEAYRRTRLPFAPGSPISRKFGKLRARQEYHSIKDEMIKSRANALHLLGDAKGSHAEAAQTMANIKLGRIEARTARRGGAEARISLKNMMLERMRPSEPVPVNQHSRAMNIQSFVTGLGTLEQFLARTQPKEEDVELARMDKVKELEQLRFIRDTKTMKAKQKHEMKVIKQKAELAKEKKEGKKDGKGGANAISEELAKNPYLGDVTTALETMAVVVNKTQSKPKRKKAKLVEEMQA